MSKRMAIGLTVLLLVGIVGGSVGLSWAFFAWLGADNPNTRPLTLMAGFALGQLGGTLLVSLWVARARSW